MSLSDEALDQAVAPRVLKLVGRVAIVTGSDSGMGRAIAEAFAMEGADVAVTFHSDCDGAEETARQVAGAGRRAIVQKLDVADEGSVVSLFQTVNDRLGPPSILVNSAGSMGAREPRSSISAAGLRPGREDGSLRAVLLLPRVRPPAPRRRRRRQNRQHHLSARGDPEPAQRRLWRGQGRLLTFTRSLALEVAPLRINVNAIAPGLVRTPMTMKRADDPQTRAEELPNIPWRRPGEPWEIARLALYLVCDDADYVTGQSFTIDGGLEMNWGGR